MLSTIKLLNIPRLLLVIRLLGHIVFYILIAIPALLGIFSIVLKNDFFHGALILVVYIFFHIIFSLRNASQFNNYLECLFFDKSCILPLYLIIFLLSTGLFFKSDYDRYQNEKEIKIAIEQTKQKIESLTQNYKKIQSSYEISFNTISKIDSEVEALAKKNNISYEEINKIADKISQSIQGIEQESNTIINLNKSLHAIELDKIVNFSDSQSKQLVAQKSALIEYSNIVKNDGDQAKVELEQRKKNLVWLIDCLNKENSLHRIAEDFENLKKTEKELMDEASKISILTPTFIKQKEKIFLKLSEFDIFRKKIKFKKESLLKYYQNLKILIKLNSLEEPPLKACSHLKKYWVRVRRYNDQLSEKISSKNFVKVIELIKQIDLKYENELSHFLIKFPIETTKTELLKLKIELENEIKFLVKKQKSLTTWYKHYIFFLKSKEISTSSFLNISITDNSPVESIINLISLRRKTIEGFYQSKFELVNKSTYSRVEAFERKYNKLLAKMKIAERSYSSLKLKKIDGNQSLLNDYSNIQNSFDTFNCFVNLSQSYLKEFHNVQKYYTETSEKINNKTNEILNKLVVDNEKCKKKHITFIDQIDEYQEKAQTICKGIKIGLEELNKNISEYELILQEHPISIISHPFLSSLPTKEKQVSNDIKMLQNHSDTFNKNISEILEEHIKYAKLYGTIGSLPNIISTKFETIKTENDSRIKSLSQLKSNKEFSPKQFIDSLNKLHRKIKKCKLKNTLIIFVLFIFIALFGCLIYMIVIRFIKRHRLSKCQKMEKESAVDKLVDTIRNTNEKIYLREYAIDVLKKMGVSHEDEYNKVKRLVDEISRKNDRIEKKIFAILNDVLINIERRISRLS